MAWTVEEINRVWEKAEIIANKNPNTHRKDRYGNVIYRNSYGKKSDLGWEIDHLKPVSKGGTNHLNNLSPTYWKKNRQKGSKYPYKP